MLVTELVPHFEQSDAAYIAYPGIKDAYEKFDLEISFKPEATDGQIPFNCFMFPTKLHCPFIAFYLLHSMVDITFYPCLFVCL